ncbi:MAG: adenosylcobinamide-GDP ribazoletransferase [Acidimicrobiales bacterium]
MSAALASLRDAVAFLTVVGRGGRPSSGTLTWFPPVGAGIGLVVGLSWWGAAEIWPPLVAAVVVVAVDLVITGALHHDGLADSADGLLPHMATERRLEVMRMPDVGAFAAVVLAVTIAARLAVFASVSPDVLAVAGIWCASRTAMAVTARALPYARSDGLAAAFLGGSPIAVLAIGCVLTAALLSPAGWRGLAAAAALVAATTAVAALARRRLGGFTGDVLGAIGVLGETAALLTLAAAW